VTKGVVVPGVGRRTGGSHHIADVAHHFLGDSPSRPLREGAIPAGGCKTVQFFAVAAAGRNPTSAFAASALVTACEMTTTDTCSKHGSQAESAAAAGAPGVDSALPAPPVRATVFLREWPGQDWSAYRYLRGSRPMDLNEFAPVTYGGPGPGGCAALGGGLLAASRPAAASVQDAPPSAAINWLHLGPVAPDQLAALESARRWRRGVGCPVAGSDGLVWCLVPTDACSYRAAYMLGRLAAACRPRRVAVVVFPDRWDGASSAVMAESRARSPHQAVRGEEIIERCRELTATVLDELPVTITILSGRDGTADLLGEFARLASRLREPDRA
jgi:hypothetical protein